MTAFTPDAELNAGLDFRLMANSFVTLFCRRSLLEESTTWLDEHGYQVTILDAATMSSPTDLLKGIGDALDFPDYYGRGLDAFNDCFCDVASYGAYGIAPEATGLVLVFTDFDRFAAAYPETAQDVLDIIADNARRAALFGRRVMCLVHSSDPCIEFAPVGAMPVVWNHAESRVSHQG
ncbi:barstar family protein [Streptomyces sp. CBMA152]|uniref:barstar family protein n=1 Tax=Streptomyces sp. CBMA152 TaxID=1896312 RepID=UPI001660922A|nr:barstar family protein [Streptomyces sp. CBMA152]MBD0741383.1 barnase inhibitor [Streptomyces sp. CBMA152]